MVYPLITKADGTKFGKTESGSVWLSPERTSPYRFYQFWLNTTDKDAIPYLKYFTWRTQSRSPSWKQRWPHPEQREAQKVLARDMTALVHDTTALAKAEQASQALFGGEISGLSGAEIADIFCRSAFERDPAPAHSGRQPFGARSACRWRRGQIEG